MIESKTMITEVQYKIALTVIENYWKEKRNNTDLINNEFEIELFESQETIPLDSIFKPSAAAAIVNCYQQNMGIYTDKNNTNTSFKIADLQKLDATNLKRFRGFGKCSKVTLENLLEKYEFKNHY